MNRNLLLCITLSVLSLALVGCGSGGSSNPVTVEAIPDAAHSTSFKVANVRYAVASQPKRKFITQRTTCDVKQRIKDCLKDIHAKVKLAFQPDTNSPIDLEVSNITFTKKAKSSKEKAKSFVVPVNKTISFNSQGIGDVLADALEGKEDIDGEYNYIDFEIINATVKEEDGKIEKVKVPFKKLRLAGNYQIQSGFETNLIIKFTPSYYKTAKYVRHVNSSKTGLGALIGSIIDHFASKWNKNDYKYVLRTPVIKFSTELTPIVVLKGDIEGSVREIIKGEKIVSATVSAYGPDNYTASMNVDQEGRFKFVDVPAGMYTVIVTDIPNHVDASYEAEVVDGQVTDFDIRVCPEMIEATIPDLEWFTMLERAEIPTRNYVHAQLGESVYETALAIDFNSVNFASAVLEYETFFNKDAYNGKQPYNRHQMNMLHVHCFISPNQIISADQIIKDENGETLSWYSKVYDVPTLDRALIEKDIEIIPDVWNQLKFDVTEKIKANPSNRYYLAFMVREGNANPLKIRNIKLTINYKAE